MWQQKFPIKQFSQVPLGSGCTSIESLSSVLQYAAMSCSLNIVNSRSHGVPKGSPLQHVHFLLDRVMSKGLVSLSRLPGDALGQCQEQL